MRRLVFALAVLAACGSERAATEEDRVRAVIERYVSAIRLAGWKGACELFTETSQAAFIRVGGSCAGAMEAMLAGYDVRAIADSLKIGRITVSGDRATAGIRMADEPSDDPMQLVKVAGGWRIDEKLEASEPAKPTFVATSTDERDVTALVVRHMRAISTRAWQAVCDNRIEIEQNQLAQRAGSCAAATQQSHDRIGVELFATMEVKRVEVTGDDAEIWIGQPDQDALDDSLRATRTVGGWRMYDAAPDQSP